MAEYQTVAVADTEMDDFSMQVPVPTADKARSNSTAELGNSLAGGGGDDDGENYFSIYEPRPGENTYKGDGGSARSSTRPTLEYLRQPQEKKENLQSMFADDGGDEVSVVHNIDDDGVQLHNPIEEQSSRKKEPVKFGMWDGVFARCLLNIFGVIMFLRVPWLVAYAGAGMSIVIILVSVAITTITTLSLSAICTNGEIKGGGAYYLISRSLGPEFGGAIGVMFFFANAVAISMYLIGFAETIVSIAGGQIFSEAWDLRIVSIISLFFILVICLIGVEYVVKVQLGLLALLIVSLITFLVGSFMSHPDIPAYVPFGQTFADNWMPDYLHKSAFSGHVFCPNPNTGVGNFSASQSLTEIDGKVNFGTALAVFFPAVTGIMAGANISGDLKDASTAIPFGTNFAVAVSTVVYIILVLFVAATGLRSVESVYVGDQCPFGGIYHDYTYMARISAWPPVVYAGIFASTLSSGIASLVGAPRILQAVAKDKLFPKTEWLAKGFGPSEEPMAAYAFTFCIAFVCILIGDLNAIAPLITNFFMCSYALTNFACFMASISRSPGWRPTFTYYNRWMSLAGALICTGFMLFLNLYMGFASIAVGMLLYGLVASVAPEVNWGSAAEGYRYVNAMRAMKTLANTSVHVKNWRPEILVLLDFDAHTEQQDPRTIELMELATDLRKGHGVIIAGNVLVEKKEEEVEEEGTPQKLNESHQQAMFLANEALTEVMKSEASNPFAFDKACRLAMEKKFAEISVIKKKDDLNTQKFKTSVFGHVLHAPSLLSGAQALLATAGLGGMRPNTLMFGFMDNWRTAPTEKIMDYVRLIGSAFDNQYGVVILRASNRQYSKERAAGAKAAEREPERAMSIDNDESSIIDADADARANTMDCWWFSDDGGLTMILPHLLLKSKCWRSTDTPMRLMNPLREDRVSDTNKEIMRIQTLVRKFRIGCSVSNILLSNLHAPKKGTYEELEEAITKKGVLKLSNADKQVTKMRVRIGEIIDARSRKARLCVISIPVPLRSKEGNELYARLYMGWLDAISVIADKLPVLMVHGNQEDALTFYS